MDTRVERRAPSALPCDLGWNQILVALKGLPDGKSVSLRGSPQSPSLQGMLQGCACMCPSRHLHPGHSISAPEREPRACSNSLHVTATKVKNAHVTLTKTGTAGSVAAPSVLATPATGRDSLGVEGSLTGGADNANILEVAAATRR